MSAKNNRSTGTQRGSALLGLGVGGLLLAYYIAGPEDYLSPSDPAPEESLQAAVPLAHVRPKLSEARLESGSPAFTPGVSNTDTDRPEVYVTGHTQSLLQEAELEHLSDVFLNIVYPLFRYDFQLSAEGRSAINVFVASMPEGMGTEDLERVAAMIDTQLSSPESEDLAFVITHLYRLEAEEARILSEGAPVTTMAGQLEAQERLAELREEWFGPELSELLFSGSDENQASAEQITDPSRPGGSGAEAPPEALTEEQAELAAIKLAWEQRYQEYLAEKRVIERAGLDQPEKDRQIEALLQQHYSPQELDAARAFDGRKN